MEKTSNPKEEFALNVLYMVVDNEIAAESIAKGLPLQSDNPIKCPWALPQTLLLIARKINIIVLEISLKIIRGGFI